MNNDEIATQLLDAAQKLIKLANELQKNARKHSDPVNSAPPRFDLYCPEALQKLPLLTHSELLSVVRDYGLDPSGQKIRKWRDPERIRQYVIERREEHLRKSDTYC